MAKVKLDEIIEQFSLLNDSGICLLSKNTGEIITLAEEYFRYAEDDDLNPDDYSDWELEEIKLAKEILNSDDDYIRFPDSFSIAEYQVMKDFCYNIRNEEKSNMLLESINGNGAFQRFKENVNKMGLWDDWEKFRHINFKQKAIDWCKENKIEYF